MFCIMSFSFPIPFYSDDDWEVLLKLHLQWRCDNLEEKYNPLPGDKPYK